MFKKRLVNVILGMALAGAFSAAQAASVSATALKDTPTELEITWTGNLGTDTFALFSGLGNWVVSGPVVAYPVPVLPTLFVATIGEAWHNTNPHDPNPPETSAGPVFSASVAGFWGGYTSFSAMADHNGGPWISPANWTNPHWDHYSFAVNSDASGNATIQVKALHPVPEPETYAMLLAGLGVIGAIARRRRSRR